MTELSYLQTHFIYTDHNQFVTASAGAVYQFCGRIATAAEAFGDNGPSWCGIKLSADAIYGSGLRDGDANIGTVPAYTQVNVGIKREFLLPNDPRPMTIRFDVVNLFDSVYEIRDGSASACSRRNSGRAAAFPRPLEKDMRTLVSIVFVVLKTAGADALMRRLIYLLSISVALAIGAGAAQAHPHVWVTAASELIFAADGSITGVRHAWIFDDMFSTYALQGIKTRKKGVYTREELAPLAQTNIEFLKEFGFLHVRQGRQQKSRDFAEPIDYYLEYQDLTR